MKHGSLGQAARLDDTYLAWGFTPSPIAVKTVSNILNLYHDSGFPPRRVFYLCYAGTHSSVTAGAIHIGGLSPGDDPSGLPQFDRRLYADIGVPYLVGMDAWGAEVYALGTGWLSTSLEFALCDLVELASPEAKACFCAVRGFLNFRARLGGLMSRRLMMVFLGRRLISHSIQRAYPKIREATDFCLDLSRRWKDNQGQHQGEVIWVYGPNAGRAHRQSRKG